jgi:hypothetical protein
LILVSRTGGLLRRLVGVACAGPITLALGIALAAISI